MSDLLAIAARLPTEIHAVLFDMDGVLIDSEPAHAAATLDSLSRRDLPLPDAEEWETIFAGRPDRDGLHDWFAHHAITTAPAEVMADSLTTFLAAFSEAVLPFADGQQLARDLAAAGLPLALVTGARRDEAALVIQHFALEGMFRARVTADDVDRGKPDPLPYLEGARLLGVDPRHCVVIEDSVAGALAAEAAGIPAIVVDRIQRPERFPHLQPLAGLTDAVRDLILSRAVLSPR